jgi:hypothetical protein
MHKNAIGGKVARKQQKAIVGNVGVKEDNLENCMLDKRTRWKPATRSSDFLWED